MRRKLLQSVLGLSLLVAASDGNAQNIRLIGPRLFVNSPASLEGIKTFTYSSSATPTWGRALDSSWFNVEVVKAVDSLACGPLTNNVTDKWVLIYRGTCQFGEKALNAQNKGAKGVIIVNNVAGAPVGMAAGTAGASVNIPVLMVSDVDGNAMNAALNGGQQVFISLTRWGFGNNNDLAIIPNSEAPGPGSIPLNQWKTGSPDAYKFYTGAFIANTGLNDQTNVKLKSTLTFTPTGGSPSVIANDSVEVASFNAIDSAIELLGTKATSVNPTQTGKYTMTYNVSADNIDDNPLDNTVSISLDVTNNIFCKAPLDANGDPILTGSVKAGASGVPLTWGPLFYVNKGGYQAQSFKLSINDNDTTKHSLNSTVGNLDIYLFKWADGNTDGIIQATELTIKGAASRVFTTADSNNQMFTANIGNPDGTTGTVVLEDNSWYWAAVDMPETIFLGCNDDINYFNRTNAARNATTPVKDFWAPNFFGTVDAMLSSGSNVRMIPFGVTEAGSGSIDSADFVGTRNTTPVIALITGLFDVSVKETQSTSSQVSLYPNPATDNINVTIDLATLSHRADIKIIDALGRNVYTERRKDIQKDRITISTKQLAAGNYYLVFFEDNGTVFKPFTVAGK
jgi:hypothetical protein